MISPQALIRGIVQRGLPSAINTDNSNTDVAARQWCYGELATQPLMRKSHVLADEGSYFVANNAQTGIASNYTTSFNATVGPFFTVYNGSITNQRLYLDYISLTAIAAGASTTTAGYIAAGLVIDNVNRYSSGGTSLTPTNPNMAAPVNASGATVVAGAVTATAASASARTLMGQRTVRPAVSSTVINVVGDMYFFNFGGVEGTTNGNITIANPTLVNVPCPPVIVPPGSTALFYIWYPVLTAPSAATFAPEIGFWVR